MFFEAGGLAACLNLDTSDLVRYSWTLGGFE